MADMNQVDDIVAMLDNMVADMDTLMCPWTIP